LKRSFAIPFILFVVQLSTLKILGQEIPPVTEQQLENLADNDPTESEDDSYLLQLEHFKKHPLNLNEADATVLKEFFFLSALQIDHLLSYQKLLGKFISIYELQSVPGWDIATIRKILPYVIVSDVQTFKEGLNNRIRKGDHSLLLRVSATLERSEGFYSDVGATKYLGGRERLFLRYRYQYKNLLQYGISADKDAGEQFFKGAQKYGFDFYSFHLFASNMGRIRKIALGDFIVNMGQGLIQWQSLAFKKTADVMGIKRQSPILNPYHSSGEFYFHRGVAITMQQKNIEVTAFGSMRKVGAHLEVDTVNHENFFSSFLNSGYHRTQSEITDRNNLQQLSFGGNINFHHNNLRIGLNGIYYHFSLAARKQDEPYNKYMIEGESWNNFSVDYSYSFRNLHFFGEAAVDKNVHKAFLNGLLISPDPKVDFSILHRSISREYQAVYGNAFTENTFPTNETGLFAGISVRPLNGWRLEMYADIYTFPWLKYLVDAPGSGRDFLAQLTYIPNKQIEIYQRFRTETKQSNQPDNTTVTNYLVAIPKQSWRSQINFKLDKAITLRSRMELLKYNKNTEHTENGFLQVFDFLYKPLLKPFSGNVRLQYFETDGYNSRIYAYENDVLYGYSIPAFYDKGWRYYFNFNYNLRKHLSFWFRWSQTVYRDKKTLGSGLDEIPGNKKSEVKLQTIWFF
jgi:hypothetical protein